MSDVDTPQYEHDCAACRFLGRYNYLARFTDGSGPVDVDLYVCNEGYPSDLTLIARRGNMGSEYTSYTYVTVKSFATEHSTLGTYTPGVIEAFRRFNEQKKENGTNESSSVSER